MKYLSLLPFCLLIFSDLFAQNPHLVKDINTSTSWIGHVKSPIRELHAEVNGVLLYPGTDINGEELWRTDGTPAGTYMLKDLRPGTLSAEPEEFFSFNNKAYFTATAEGNTGDKIWVSDGTSKGTVPLLNLRIAGNGNTNFHAFNGAVYFIASDQVNGYELWKTDGTQSGTVMVKDIFPGAGHGAGGRFIQLGAELIFAASNGTNGYELWKTDGTTNGTVMVKDIRPGSSNSLSGQVDYQLFKGEVYFRADDGINGQELWKSDGTTNGTLMVSNLVSGSGSSFPDIASSVVIGNELFWAARNNSNTGQIFKTLDGTSVTTVQLTSFSGSNSIQSMIAHNDRIIFSASGGGTGYEPWKTETTPGTDSLLLDIKAGSGSSLPSDFIEFNGKVLFRADDDTLGYELFITDGLVRGTRMLKDIQPGSGDGFPYEFTELGGTLYFRGTSANGAELWKTDGSPAGTQEVINLQPGMASSSAGSFVPFNNQLLFWASDTLPENELGLFITDGTASGTQKLVSPRLTGDNEFNWHLAYAGHRLFFSRDDGISGNELWSSDGSGAGTQLAVDLNPGRNSSYPVSLTEFNGKVVFSAYNPNTNRGDGLYISDGTPGGTTTLLLSLDDIRDIVPLGNKLVFAADTNQSSFVGDQIWTSDGTVNGTLEVTQIRSGPQPERLTRAGNEVWYGAEQYGSTAVWGVYKTDGTPGGTGRVKDFNFSSNNSGPGDYFYFNGHVYFGAADAGQPHDLWKSDGSLNGTVLLKADCNPGSFAQIGNELLFTATDATNGYELWKTDGTVNGTVLVKDINPGPGDGFAHFGNRPAVLGNRIFFTGDDGSGKEVWMSDGTSAGTQKVQEINPAGDGVVYDNFRTKFLVHDGYVYFTGVDCEHGAEMWRTNGNPGGTQLVGDMNPGPPSSLPYYYTSAGDSIYFTAISQEEGRELWVFDSRCIMADVTLSSQQLCEGELLRMNSTASTLDSIISYQWDLGNGTQLHATDTSYMYTQAGTYVLSLNLATVGGCSVTLSDTVNIFAPPQSTPMANDTLDCVSNPFQFSTPSGIPGITTYTWNFGDGNNSTAQNPSHTYANSGTFQVQLIASNGSQCSDTAFLSVTAVATHLSGNISQSILCHGDSSGEITLLGSGGIAPLSYSLDGVTFQSSPVFSGLAAGTYQAFVADTNGCTSNTSISLADPAPISITAINTTSEINGNDASIQLTATGGTGGLQYKLNGGAFQPSNTFSGLTNGTYTVIVQDGNGCDTTLTVVILKVALDPGQGDGSIRLYPNPGISEFYLEFPDLPGRKVSYKIYSPQGKRIGEGNLPVGGGPHKIDLPSGVEGVYLLLLELGGERYYFKIVSYRG